MLLIKNGRFGSLAALFTDSSLMSGFGWKADIREPDFTGPSLNVCFSRKRTFRLAKPNCFEGPLSAKSGHSIDPKSNSATRSKRPIADIVVVAPEHCLPKTGCIPEPFIYAVFEPLATHF